MKSYLSGRSAGTTSPIGSYVLMARAHGRGAVPRRRAALAGLLDGRRHRLRRRRPACATAPAGHVRAQLRARSATRPTPRSWRSSTPTGSGRPARSSPLPRLRRAPDGLRARAKPGGRSFMIGFGANPPRNPHHRTAHGSGANNPSASPPEPPHRSTAAWSAARPSRTTSPGATDPEPLHETEVATDFNAGLTSALARWHMEFGGTRSRTSRRPRRQTTTRSSSTPADQRVRARTSPRSRSSSSNRSAWPSRSSTTARSATSSRSSPA